MRAHIKKKLPTAQRNIKKYYFRKDSPYEKVDYWLQRFDQLFNLSNIYLFDKTYAEAKALGFKQIIDGIDGDLVVSHGWERFKELFSLTKFPLFTLVNYFVLEINIIIKSIQKYP